MKLTEELKQKIDNFFSSKSPEELYDILSEFGMTTNNLEVKVKKLNEKAVIPFYGSDGAAGMDIIPTSVEYKKDIDCYVYHTGLSFEIPEGYVMLIFPRSSNRKTNVYLPNSVAIIDSDYRGEVLICFKNRTSYGVLHKICELISPNMLSEEVTYLCDEAIDREKAYEIDGKAIAQLMIIPYPKIMFKEVEELSSTKRGEGGFGSTNMIPKVGNDFDKDKEVIETENIKYNPKELDIWIARDKDNGLYMFTEKPTKTKTVWHNNTHMLIDENLFPDIRWSDNEPTKAKIIINE